ncbi:universal stress protein [Bacillus sp. FJAT-47783]|uniref:universal stress protein n=1 Tax=Bacillus sp. FJAT-47783 TaxID=2922712 RepID=UPI001FAC19E8|nr:universal stress protein [Bacillus sp. FJAT-47783]
MSFKYENIVVAVDGSKEAEKAFKKAISITKRNDAKLIITHVLDDRYGVVMAYAPGIVDEVEVRGKELLEKYETEAKTAGIEKIETFLSHGSPKVKIAKEVAPKFEADLIICGATGLNAVERMFIGSVSEHVTRYAKCDVLVVRSDENID